LGRFTGALEREGGTAAAAHGGEVGAPPPHTGEGGVSSPCVVEREVATSLLRLWRMAGRERDVGWGRGHRAGWPSGGVLIGVNNRTDGVD
jgi:hypothetical protein